MVWAGSSITLSARSLGRRTRNGFTISVMLTTQKSLSIVPQGRVFLTADQKLQEGAMLSGFDTKQI
jgi:hypothetical protein